MICVASVPHTGSWFTINFLEKLLNCETRRITERGYDRVPLAHYHIGADRIGSNFGYEHLEEGKIKDEYIEYFKKFPKASDIKKYAICYKTIIPVRDAWLSLITRQNRNPLLTHELIRQGFRTIAYLNNISENVFLFPIDLYETEEDKLNLLNQLTSFVGVENDELVKETAKNWSARNTSEDTSGLKKEYLDGNLQAVIDALPNECEGFMSDYYIKTFMRNLGYTKLKWC